MADFSNIIQEINTNIPDNNTQAITAAKLRTTLIDLTNQIDTVQDDFETNLNDEFGILQNQVETALDNLVIDNLNSDSTMSALSANQGRILDEKINNIPYNLTNQSTTNVDFNSPDLITLPFVIGVNTLNWIATTSFITRQCAVIPVSAGDTIFVESLNNSCHYGFFSSYPTPVEGQSSNLIDNTLYFLNTTSIPETSRTLTVPEGSMYMYVKMYENSETINSYIPTTLAITSQKFLTDNDIVNNLDSYDINKTLSAAVGPTIKKLENAIEKKWQPSLQDNTFPFVIGISTLKWIATTDSIPRMCAIVPVESGQTLFIESIYNSCHYGFFSSYPTPVEGQSSNLMDGLHFLNTVNTPTSRTEIIPQGAKYMYVKLSEGTTLPTISYTPSKLEITKIEPITIDSYYDDTEYDTYIEEDIYSINSSMANGRIRYKKYKIDKDIEYKLILWYSSGTTNNVLFYDSSNALISGAFPGQTTDTFAKMEPLTIPEGTAFIIIRVQTGDGGEYTMGGCGALMKPLKNDGTMPKNKNVYCVSKVRFPYIPYDYTEEGTTYQNTEVWSAWSFMFPTNAESITAAKYPIVSFFHGSSGFLTSEVMSYNSALTDDGIVGRLRSNGCIVFDINGYGISRKSDNYSRHWGCPAAVNTVKKAYEILVSRFNGRRGMVISGISMGGAIAKSYCMIHPDDVVAAALEAPSDMGYTCRSSSAESVYTAWGYSSAAEMTSDTNRNNFIGYSPTIKPLVIQSDGSLRTMTNVMEFSSNQMRTEENINKFYAPFPVEIKIWHGDADANVDLTYSQGFVNMVRNANCNATLRLCPNCEHSLNTYEWVMNEVVNYIVDKAKI